MKYIQQFHGICFSEIYILLSIAQKKKTESNVYLDTWCLFSGTIEKKEDVISFKKNVNDANTLSMDLDLF